MSLDPRLAPETPVKDVTAEIVKGGAQLAHVRYSPQWWRDTLVEQIQDRSRLIQTYEDYYEDRHNLTFASSKFRAVFGEMLAAVSDNWMPLVIQAKTERMSVQGFRFGDEKEGDKDAWQMWQENGLDLDSRLLFVEAAKHGEAYLLVWPEKVSGTFGRFFARKSGIRPRITVEHPGQFIVAREPGDRRRRAAALKYWREDDGTLMATLFLPRSLHKWQKAPDKQWEEREPEAKNPLGLVPSPPIVNDPHMLPSYPPRSLLVNPHRVGWAAVGLGRSDLADVISTQDQINKLVCDMLVASEVAAFRQRWATGLQVPVYPAGHAQAGEPVESFKSALDRLWISPGKDVTFGEFSATDLKNFSDAWTNRTNSLAARTRTPPHYMLGQIVNVSGDALDASEAGLDSRVSDSQDCADEGLEEAVQIGFMVTGDKRARVTDSETIWAPSQRRSESAWMDSLVKKMALGVPKEQLWADAGYSPQQIGRFKDMLKAQAEEMPPGPPPDTNALPAEPQPAEG